MVRYEYLRWLIRTHGRLFAGGPHGPYVQSERAAWYLEIWRQLEATGAIYPSPHSRRDVEEAATAPHEEASITGVSTTPAPANPAPPPPAATPGIAPIPEPLFPPALRPARRERASEPGALPWRFRVPDGRVIEFEDGLCGRLQRTAGVDFGDFIVWRRDDLAAYELAVVADAHAPLVCDASGTRLAKRTGGLAIRDLRAAGRSPADLLTWPVASLGSPATAPRHTS